MLKLIIRATALTFGVCLATLPTPQATSQALSNLNDRMTEMVNALHAASPLAKLKPATETQPATTSSSSSSESTALTYPYYQVPSMPLPPLVYMPLPSSVISVPTVPTTTGLASGIQPIDYVHPVMSNPVTRSIMPSIPYSYPSFYPFPPCEIPQRSYPPGFMAPPSLSMPIPTYHLIDHPYHSYPTKQMYPSAPLPYPLIPLTELSPKSAEFLPRYA